MSGLPATLLVPSCFPAAVVTTVHTWKAPVKALPLSESVASSGVRPVTPGVHNVTPFYGLGFIFFCILILQFFMFNKTNMNILKKAICRISAQFIESAKAYYVRWDLRSSWIFIDLFKGRNEDKY